MNPILFYTFLLNDQGKLFNTDTFNKENLRMKTRRDFLSYLFLSLSAVITALVSVSCGKKPDVETEPSPEWPPKE
jgi:hypothetical protein